MSHWTARLRVMSRAHPTARIGVPLSLSVALLFYFATAKAIEHDSRERFAGHARNAQNTIKARIKSYTDVLRGTASLFKTADPITRAQFHAYVSGLGLPHYFPAIETINFARTFSQQDRAAVEQRMRDTPMAPRDGTPFVIRPPGQRDEYSAFVFVEPEAIGTKSIGLDLQANPLVQPTLAALRDNGVLISSGMPIAAMSGPNRTGLGMRLPIYRPNMPTETVSERRAAYIGSVGIAFSVHKLVRGVLDEMPIANVRMTLVDHALGVDRKRGRVLFDSGAVAREPGRLPLMSNEFSTTLPIGFNGREWGATFTTEKRNLHSATEEYFPWLAALAGFGTSMLIYALFHALSSSRQRAIKMAKGMTRELRASQAKLQQSHENLRRLAAHADEIKEGERKRIAREIHDDLGQNLLALRIEADMLRTRTRDRHPRLHARACTTLSQIDATIRSVRQIINDLRPNVLDLGLNAAVEWQIAEFRRRSGISCELVDDHQELGLPDHCATAFFRILQESLTNIVRHAHASAVKVELKTQAGQLWMTINDNGVGLHPGTRDKSGSFGLVGIEERIHILGGSLDISGMPNAGTTVRVSVPLHADRRRAAGPPPTTQPPIRKETAQAPPPPFTSCC